MPIPGGMSLDQLREKINAVLNPGDRWTRYVRELYEDRVIIAEDEKLFEAAYTVNEGGDIELGEFRPVKVEYVPAKFAVALKVGTIPTEIQLLPAGRFKTDKGEFELTSEAVGRIVEDYGSKNTDMVVDYEHQTLTGGEAPAAGWIKKLVDKGKDGLWAVVEWTDRAKEYLKNREYRYLSPAFEATKKEGLITRLINAALTNLPGIDGMVPVVNKRDIEPPEKRKEVSMKKLMELLGLKADATEDQAVEKVQAMKAEVDALKPTMQAHAELVEALGLKEGASLSEVKGTVVALKQGSEQNSALATEVKELKDKIQKKEAAERVAVAMKAGKITPGQKEWALKYSEGDPAGFEAFVAAQPVVVPLKEIAGGDGPGGGDQAKKRDHLVAEYMKANAGVSLKDATLAISKEYPELFKD